MGADVNVALPATGETALYGACYHGHASTVQVLVQSNVDINKCRVDDGTSPLCIASYKGNLEVVKILTQYNADLNQVAILRK